MANKNDSGSGMSKERIEEQIKKAMDTALAGLGDDSRNELQGCLASAVSTALSAGLKPLMEQKHPSSQEKTSLLRQNLQEVSLPSPVWGDE